MSLNVVIAVLLGIAAVSYVALGVRLLHGKRELGSIPLAIGFFAIGVWVAGGALETVATTYPWFLVGRNGHFVGTAIVPVMILLCFREYTGRETSASAVVAMLIIPVLSIVIAATNQWHQFMWQLPAVGPGGEYLTRPERWGPWFYFVHLPYGYAAIGVSMLTLILHSTAVTQSQRRSLYLLAGSSIVPVIGIMAYDFGIGPNTFSLLPIIFSLMLPIYAWLLLGERLMEYTPLAYETVFQNMQDPVIVVDDQQRIIGLNRGAEALLCLRENEAMRISLEQIFGREAVEVHEAIDTGKPQKMMTKSGRFLHLQVTPIKTANFARTARVLMFRDVSDVEKAQREVATSEKLLRTLVDHSVNGIIRLRWQEDDGPEGRRELRCIFANSAAGRYLGINPDEINGSTAKALLTHETSGLDPQDAESLLDRISVGAAKGVIVDAETCITRHGESRWFRVICEPVGDDVAITFVDTTDKKAKEIQMESIAWSDPLTGVLNRRGFERDAARRLTESPDDATGALLFIDLNEFKQINDRFGHEVGDELLKIAAERLTGSLRGQDIVGRPGGDEFVALVPDVEATTAEDLATRLAASLERPYHIGNQSLRCAASIGLALYPEHANTLTGLLRAADAAMYRAKARCRGVTNISDRDLLEKAI